MLACSRVTHRRGIGNKACDPYATMHCQSSHSEGNSFFPPTHSTSLIYLQEGRVDLRAQLIQGSQFVPKINQSITNSVNIIHVTYWWSWLTRKSSCTWVSGGTLQNSRYQRSVITVTLFLTGGPVCPVDPLLPGTPLSPFSPGNPALPVLPWGPFSPFDPLNPS